MLTIIPKYDDVVLAVEGQNNNPILSHKEIRCKCNNDFCLSTPISSILIQKFNNLRLLVGNNPILISSGYRCPAHNRMVGGTPTSKHQHGMAMDMHTPKNLTLDKFEELAILAGFSYTKKYKETNVLHCDVRGLE